MGFWNLNEASYQPSTYKQLSTEFNLCANSTLNTTTDVQNLLATVADGLGTMAMVNYPYETNFIGKLPAWPVLESCKRAAGVSITGKVIDSFDYSNITRLAAMFNLTYNYEDKATCFDMNAGGSVGLDDSGWTVQTCSQFPMP